MNISKLQKILKSEPAFRIQQVKRLLFIDLIDNWDEASTLPKELIEKLQSEIPLETNSKLFHSIDGKTVKALLTLADGLRIETVLMMHKDGRNSVCVSSQVGCSLGCTFCATGGMGFQRDLRSDEIISQVLLFARILKKKDKKVRNVVYMGMGEPFLNYDNVIESINILNDKDALNIGARRISISTSGVIPGIEQLSKEKLQVNLAISLHASNDEVRDKIMPINKKYPIEALMTSVDKYIQKTNRKVMFEYLLIAGINDTEESAYDLAKLLKGKLTVVNLIPCNPVGKYKPSSRIVIDNVKRILQDKGIEVVQRYSFGQDIKAACGQLAGSEK